MSLFGRVGTAGTPTTGGLFGAPPSTPSTQTPSGGLFGPSAAAASSAPSSGGLFGSSTTTTTAPSSGGLFGSSTTTASAPTPGGLFGSSTATSTTTSSGGGLFGGSNKPAPINTTGLSSITTTSAPSQGGLFGASGTTTTSAPASGGLFGTTNASSAAPASGTAAGGSLFGGGTVQAGQTPTSGGLFGSSTTTTQPPTGGGLFGSSTTATQPATGGLFGPPSAATQPPTGGLFTASAIQTQQPQQNTIPAATVDVSKLTPTTRFGDCHQSVQQDLETLEKEIQEQIKLSTSLADRFPTHRAALDTIPTDASILSHRLATTKLFQSSDLAAYESVRAQHDQDDQASTLSIRNLDLFRLPHAQRSQLLQRTSIYNAPPRETDVTTNKPMISYFNRQADEVERKKDLIVRAVVQVEESLRSVEVQAIQGAQGVGIGGRDLTAVTGGQAGKQDARRLNRTLREFNDAMKDVSARIVDAREALESLARR